MPDFESFKLVELSKSPRKGGYVRGRRKAGSPPPLVFCGKQVSSYAAEGFANPANHGLVEPGMVRTVTSRSLCDLGIDTDQLGAFMPAREVPRDALTQVGDVLVLAAPPFTVACVDEESAGCFIGTAFTVVRLANADLEGKPGYMDLDPWFLAAYLDSSPVRALLDSKSKGGRSRSVSIATVEGVDIPAVDPQRQRKLGALAHAYADSARARRRLGHVQREAVDAAVAKAIVEMEAEGGGRHGA